MFGSKIKLDKQIINKVKKYYQIAGYASPEEFIVHALEKEITRFEEGEEDDKVKERLKGLGYIS